MIHILDICMEFNLLRKKNVISKDDFDTLLLL